MAAVDYATQAKFVHALLSQDKKWIDRRGEQHDVGLMSVRYKRNVVGFLERRAASLSRLYQFGQLDAVFAPIGREVIHVDALTGEETLGDIVYGGPRGEVAESVFERGLNEQQKQIDDDPVTWLRNTPLLRRLITDVENGLGGTDGDDEHRRWLKSQKACGPFVADGHEVSDPTCGACIEANSDAPDWTIS